MSLFSWFSKWFSNAELNSNSSENVSYATTSYHDDFAVNPASGLPMIGGMTGLDIEGNPYGTDLHDSFEHTSALDMNDSFPSNTWDD